MARRSVFADDPELIAATERLLRRHDAVNAPAGEQSSEDDIRRAIADLLIASGLAEPDEIRLEADRNDLRTGDLLIEVKRRIGAGLDADRKHIAQLDGYLERARARGQPERLGILADGKHWVLRIRGDGELRTDASRAFTLHSAAAAIDLVQWLKSRTQALPEAVQEPSEAAIEAAFALSASAESFLSDIATLYESNRHRPTVTVKRELWQNLLAAALGEAINEEADLSRLFVRHTYLSTIVALAVQAAFGVDITDRPAEALINGRTFFTETGVRGVIESDFFGWPSETEAGREWITRLAQRVERFDWAAADYDVARVLYQAVIDAQDRRRLGEYYTPDWLAGAVVDEVFDDPLSQRVLDPACGSGTFLRAAVQAYVGAAGSAGLTADQTLAGLRERVIGIDVHPVAVHLARVTWVLAAKSVLQEADSADDMTVPVYLGDSLQLVADPGSLFDTEDVTIEIKPTRDGGAHRFLHFPKALVAQGDWFDDLMLRASRDVEAGLDASATLDDAGIPHGRERDKLGATLRVLADLHREGRDHIWAYYTRNLVRPAWLSTGEGRVDRVVGNPPWLTFSRAEATLRKELERLSKDVYNIWVGGKYAPHQDIAGLFFTRVVDLYLREGGRCGMVVPHSALIAGQYEKWRTGRWRRASADLSEVPWDLEKIEPNTFFPITACTIFARKAEHDRAAALSSNTLRWLGPEGGPYAYEQVALSHSLDQRESPYGERATQGATIVPRLLFFVHATESTTAVTKGVMRVRPMRSKQEHPPWKELNPPMLSEALEPSHLHPVHRGDTIVPYVPLEPRHAALPLRRDETTAPWPGDRGAVADVNAAGLDHRMRDRWRAMDALWETHKGRNNKLTLIKRLDYHRGLSRQLERHPIRVLYTTSGQPTAALLTDPAPLVDSSLYWLACDTLAEACYLVAVINSDALYRAVEPLMPTGQFGARHLHKHLWKLPIAAYDPGEPLHLELAEAGSALADRASEVLAEHLRGRTDAAPTPSVRTARRWLRDWLATSEISQQIEEKVESLLASLVRHHQ